jgi:hypothetical protein
LNCEEISQYTTNPSLVDIICATTSGFFLDSFLSLFLGANEDEVTTISYDLPNKSAGLFQSPDRLLQVDDMDTITLCENIRLHPRMPAASLMTKMGPGFKKLFKGCTIGTGGL